MKKIDPSLKVVATIECRMASSRLPGKALLKSCGKPILAHMIERVRRVQRLDQIVVATTVNPGDDCLVDLAAEMGVGCYRGSEEDVLRRVLEAADSAAADVIVELTGDCPVIDPQIISQTLHLYLANDCDYVNNDTPPSFPMGMDVEVFSTELLRIADREGTTPEDREHVSWFFVRNPARFRNLVLPAPQGLRWPDLRLTLDERADFELIDAVLGALLSEKPDFGCGDILEFLRSRPQLLALNRHVQQRGWHAA